MLKSVYKSIKIEFEYDSWVFFLSKTDFKTCMNLYTAEHTQDANEVVCRKFHLGILIIFVNKINNLKDVMCQGAFRREGFLLNWLKISYKYVNNNSFHYSHISPNLEKKLSIS